MKCILVKRAALLVWYSCMILHITPSWFSLWKGKAKLLFFQRFYTKSEEKFSCCCHSFFWPSIPANTVQSDNNYFIEWEDHYSCVRYKLLSIHLLDCNTWDRHRERSIDTNRVKVAFTVLWKTICFFHNFPFLYICQTEMIRLSK